VAAEAIAAGATALAAVVTAWMAIETHRVADKTRQAAEAAVEGANATQSSADATREAAEAALREARAVERQLEVSTQPWLTWTGEEGFSTAGVTLDGTPVGIIGNIRVRNVGNGLALIRGRDSSVLGARDGQVLQPYVFLTTPNPVLRPNDVTVLYFDVARVTATWGELTADSFMGKPFLHNGLFGFDVVYSDAAGAVTYRARFQAVPGDPQHGRFRVFQVDYFREDGKDPIASVRID
jgi:hypothetical protein